MGGCPVSELGDQAGRVVFSQRRAGPMRRVLFLVLSCVVLFTYFY